MLKKIALILSALMLISAAGCQNDSDKKPESSAASTQTVTEAAPTEAVTEAYEEVSEEPTEEVSEEPTEEITEAAAEETTEESIDEPEWDDEEITSPPTGPAFSKVDENNYGLPSVYSFGQGMSSRNTVLINENGEFREIVYDISGNAVYDIYGHLIPTRLSVGRLSNPVKVNDYTYECTVEECDNKAFTVGETVYIYAPGAPSNLIPKEAYSWNLVIPEKLESYVFYHEGGKAYFGRE